MRIGSLHHWIDACPRIRPRANPCVALLLALALLSIPLVATPVSAADEGHQVRRERRLAREPLPSTTPSLFRDATQTTWRMPRSSLVSSPTTGGVPVQKSDQVRSTSTFFQARDKSHSPR